MLYTSEELKDKLLEKVREVYGVFMDFFGEEYVDLQYEAFYINSALTYLDRSKIVDGKWNLDEQDFSTLKDHLGTPFIIMVYWPEVKVTNENDKSIIIKKLFAQIKITIEGRIPYEYAGFMLNRSEYTNAEWQADYMHSHICGISKNYPEEFRVPCLGTGPIRSTITSLKNECDSLLWMLFCQELSMYVTVESLRGVPYRYLEKVGKFDTAPIPKGNAGLYTNLRQFVNACSSQVLQDFTRYYLDNGHLVIGFCDGEYVNTLSYYDTVMDVSNVFINFYNRYLRDVIDYPTLLRYGFLKTVMVKDKKFYGIAGGEDQDYSRNNGRTVCTFKGQTITLEITQIDVNRPDTTTIVDPSSCLYIIEQIIKIINYRYGNNTDEGDSSSTDQKVFYL